MNSVTSMVNLILYIRRTEKVSIVVKVVIALKTSIVRYRLTLPAYDESVASNVSNVPRNWTYPFQFLSTAMNSS